MSRRDTILIAILLNVGLLVILFATARGPEDEAPAALPVVQPEGVAMEVIEPILALPAKPQGGDEIDIALERFRAIQIEQPVVEKSPPPMVERPMVQASPPPPPPAQKVEAAKFIEITVKRGDSLDKLARANGTTVEKLMRENGLTSTRLQIGQKLKMPASAKSSAVAVKESDKSQEVESSDDFYVVRSGDNPWVIAMKFRIPLDELLRLNNLNEETARKMKPGDRLRIR